MTLYDLAQQAQAKIDALEFPTRPNKPKQEKGETNAAYGARLDEFDNAMAEFKQKRAEYNRLAGEIDAAFRAEVLKHVGLEGHANAKAAEDFVRDEMSTNGFYEWAMAMNDVANLIL